MSAPIILAWLLDGGITCPACALRLHGYVHLLRRTPLPGGEPPEPLHEVDARARCAECRARLGEG